MRASQALMVIPTRMFCHMMSGCLGYSGVGDRKCFSLQLCHFQKTNQPQFSIPYPHSFPVSHFYLHYVFPFPFSYFFMLLLFLLLILIHYSYILFSSLTCALYFFSCFCSGFFSIFICLMFIQFLHHFILLLLYSVLVSLFSFSFVWVLRHCLTIQTKPASTSSYPCSALLMLECWSALHLANSILHC